MLRLISLKNMRELCFIAFVTAYCVPAIGAVNTLNFECIGDIAPQSKGTQEIDDQLYDETIQYLSGFIGLLNQKADQCASKAAIVTGSRNSDEKSCLDEKADVVKLIEQSQVILDNPEKFRVCFDAQRDYNGELYTANARVQKNHLFQSQ